MFHLLWNATHIFLEKYRMSRWLWQTLFSESPSSWRVFKRFLGLKTYCSVNYRRVKSELWIKAQHGQKHSYLLCHNTWLHSLSCLWPDPVEKLIWKLSPEKIKNYSPFGAHTHTHSASVVFHNPGRGTKNFTPLVSLMSFCCSPVCTDLFNIF